jgi:signal peptidase I
VLGIWSAIATLLMLSRVQKFGFWRTIASGAVGYLLLLLLPLLFRAFLFEPFNIPSGSMAPNLVVGDYLFVSKYQYGYSRYSLPLGARLFAGRIMGKEPDRGDVVVYRQPQNPSLDFVKRVIGLPGDSIQVIEGVLQINGQPVLREPAEDYVEIDESGHPLSKLKRWHEILPNGVSYDILDEGRGLLENTAVYTVPTGRYFVIGDHRDKSADSRLPESQGGGSVPYENLIGRVEIIYYSGDVARIGMRPR